MLFHNNMSSKNIVSSRSKKSNAIFEPKVKVSVYI